TITKNNLEAVKEVVRQLRLRDIGGIIVIDFIDMANQRNRKTVEDALKLELERDRTKTYVVEISPLGLVEMTRQNVTEGPREVMTRKCPTCGGDGIVYSEASAAIDVERRLQALANGSRSQAFRVEVAAPIAAALIGPGARRLIELETMTKRRFFLDAKPDLHLDHFVVVSEGKLADLAPPAPVAEGAELQLELVEVDRHDASSAVGKVEGMDVCVGEAAELVGKRVKVRVERVLDGIAYGSLVRRTAKAPEPLTAEAEAEKPTRKPPARKGATVDADAADGDVEVEDVEEGDEVDEVDEVEDVVVSATDPAAPVTPKKKTRRGSRGGKNRRKRVAAAAAATDGGEPVAEAPVAEAVPPSVTIHVPAEDLGTTEGNGAAPVKKKTRRGSRGGKNRRKKPAGTAAAATAVSENGAEPESAPEPAPEPVVEVPTEPEPERPEEGDPNRYVPMSEWGDEFK
ncbi:MAG TPA: ribonuclease E/G, partial [Gaiellaceae bacterium]|nr:ribonuclease E/G [Gaiellaceae bacterium]